MNMGTIRRMAALLCIGTLCLLLSAGCAREDDPLNPKQPVTLTIWHYYSGPQKIAFDNAVQEFNETVGYERGVIIEAVTKNGVNQLADEVIASARGEFGSSVLPDIFGCYGDSAYVLYRMGLLVALDGYVAEAELAEYVPAFVAEGRLGTQQLYIFPTAKSTESIFLNKTDFDAFIEAIAQEPHNVTIGYDDLKTWEGIKHVGILYNHYTDSLTPETPGDGRAFFGVDTVANFLNVGARQLGGTIARVENGVLVPGLDRAIMRRLYDVYYGGTVEGAFAKVGSYASEDIKTGDTIGMLASTTGAKYFPAEVTPADGAQYEVELLVLPMSVLEGEKAVAVSQGAGMAVIKSAPEKEYAAVLFLRWFTEAERNIEFSLESGYLPVKREALQGEAIHQALQSLGTDRAMRGTVAALEVGMTQMEHYELCYSEVFSGSFAYRRVLEDSLPDFAGEAQAQIAEGLQRGEYLAPLVSAAYGDDIFESWLDGLEAELAEAVK